MSFKKYRKVVSMSNTREKRIAMAKAIEELKLLTPERFAELQKRAKDANYDAQCREEARREFIEEARKAELERVNKPVIIGLPDIDMSGVRGLVAYKTWQFDGRLTSTAMNYHWKELNFADVIPAKDNVSGLYCIKLSSLGVMTTGSNYFSSYGRGVVSGFVELLGKVVEHSDGILRAEVAKLVCLFVTPENLDVVNTVRSLYEHYITPVYVLNPEQLADTIIREVFRQKYLGRE